MTYEITTSKGFDGWRAESTASIGETPEGRRVLKLTTHKIRGGLDAYASVYILNDNASGFTSMTTEIFGDFLKSSIAPTPCNRVTEKAVLDVHKFALLQMDKLIEEAKAFYAQREVQTAV